MNAHIPFWTLPALFLIVGIATVIWSFRKGGSYSGGLRPPLAFESVRLVLGVVLSVLAVMLALCIF